MFNCRKEFFESRDIEAYFDRSCSMYGNSVGSVGWFNRTTQELRFLMLSLIGDLNNQSVLDIGCGLGDFYGYLKKQGFSLNYHGIDFSRSMVALARKNYPDATFDKCDFFAPEFKTEYDFIFASGTFNYKVKDRDSYIRTAIEKMLAQARKGVSFNLLSSYSPKEYKDENSFHYYLPESILKLCFEYTPYVEIKHNYLPNDFTVHLFKV